MYISPISINSYAKNINYTQPKSTNGFLNNNQCDSVSFTGKAKKEPEIETNLAYKIHAKENTNEVCDTGNLSSKGKALVEAIDNKTNSVMNEIYQIGNDATKLRKEGFVLYNKAQQNILSDVEIYESNDEGKSLTVYTENGSKRKRYNFDAEGDLTNVIIESQYGAIGTEKKFDYNKEGKLVDFETSFSEDDEFMLYKKINLREGTMPGDTYFLESGVKRDGVNYPKSVSVIAYSQDEGMGTKYVSHEVTNKDKTVRITKDVINNNNGSAAVFNKIEDYNSETYIANLRHPKYFNKFEPKP